MGVQGAEPGGEVPVLDRRQALVLKEEDLTLQTGHPETRELLVIQRPGQAEIVEKGPMAGVRARDQIPGTCATPCGDGQALPRAAGIIRRLG